MEIYEKIPKKANGYKLLHVDYADGAHIKLVKNRRKDQGMGFIPKSSELRKIFTE